VAAHQHIYAGKLRLRLSLASFPSRLAPVNGRDPVRAGTRAGWARSAGDCRGTRARAGAGSEALRIAAKNGKLR